MHSPIVVWGWYPELKFSIDSGGHLCDDLLSEPQPNQDDIARYLLQARPILSMRDVIVRDILLPDQPELGVPDMLTDGLWVWPDVMGYFVQRHNLRVPQELVDRMKSFGWVPPEPTPAELAAVLTQLTVPMAEPSAAELDELLGSRTE